MLISPLHSIADEVVESTVKSMMENMPDCSESMDCLSYKYEQWLYRFRDHEDGKIYVLDKTKLLATFPLIFTDKWPKGCTAAPTVFTPEAMDQWLCQCDADDFDAFVQLACFGEVIYG